MAQLGFLVDCIGVFVFLFSNNMQSCTLFSSFNLSIYSTFNIACCYLITFIESLLNMSA